MVYDYVSHGLLYYKVSNLFEKRSCFMKKTMFIAVMAIMALLTVFTGCNNAANPVYEPEQQDGLAFVLKLPERPNQRAAYYDQSDADWYDIQIRQNDNFVNSTRGQPGEIVRIEVPREGWYTISVYAYNYNGTLIAEGFRDAYISASEGETVISITINPRRKQIGFYLEIIWAPAPDDGTFNETTGYPLKTGGEINCILKNMMPCNEAEIGETGEKYYSYPAVNFMRADKPVDTNNYLDLNNNVPVWYNEGDKTIYYYIQDDKKLVLNPESSFMFEGLDNIEYIDVSKFDTCSVLSMEYMFANCKSLVKLYVNNFNTENVQLMAHMFEGCESIQSLDLSNFSMYKVWNISKMFNYCSNLEYIYARPDTDWCKYIQEIDIEIFFGCIRLPNYTDEKTSVRYAHIGNYNDCIGYFTERE